MKHLCVPVLLFALLLGGCRQKTALRDEIVVTALGIHHKDGEYAVSVQAVDALNTAASLSEQDKAATAVYEVQGASVAAALENFLEQSGKTAYVPHNRLLVISEAQCKAAPLQSAADYLLRGGEIHAQTPLVVCRGDPTALLSLSSGNDAIPADYVVGLLTEGAARGVCVRRDLLDTGRALSGMFDAVLPIVRMNDGTPTPDGTALFRNGTFVGELTAEETTGLALLGNELNDVLFSENGVTYRVESLHTERRIERAGERFVYRFSVTGRVRVAEQQTNTARHLPAVETYIRRCAEGTLAKLNKTDCDPLGLSRQTARQDPKITQETVRSQLSGCDKTVSVDLEFIR